MEGNESNQGMQSQLCKAGCGFYGSSSSDGYCSVCFKEKLQRRMLLSEVSTTTASSTSSSSSASTSNDHKNVQTETASNSEDANNGIESGEEPMKALQTNEALASMTNHNMASSSVTLDKVKDYDEKISQPSTDSSDPDTPASVEDKAEDGESSGASKKKNRCYVCKKKVGLTGFGCRCGGLFCGIHRYSDMHECTFDYKEQGQQEIRKNNPKITFQKVAKI